MNKRGTEPPFFGSGRTTTGGDWDP